MAQEEDMQQKYMQFQFLQQQMEEINQHLELLNQNLAELDISINAVKEIENTKPDTEILAPIANGIFLKAELKDNQKMIVNVGSDITVEKTPQQVVVLLEEQKNMIIQKMSETEVLSQELNKQAMKIFEEVQQE
jgi:prefoldin alpha subunit